MKRFTGTLIFLALVTVGALRVGAQADLREALKDSTGGQWVYDDFPKALKQAQQGGRPLLVLFRCVP